MKKINPIIIKPIGIFLFLVFACTSFSQSMLEIDKKMAKYQFDESIILLKKVIQKDNKYSNQARGKLADAYRLTNQVDSAAKYYSTYLKIDSLDLDARFNFASMLRNLGLYDSAANQFEYIDRIEPENHLNASKYALFSYEINDYIDEFKKYDLKNLNAINSEQSDFSACLFKDFILFTSDRPTNLGKDKTYGWTGNSYLNIYFSKFENSSGSLEVEPPKIYGSNLQSDFHDGTTSFTKDQKTAWFTRTIKDKANSEVFDIPTHVLKLFKSEFINNKWTEPESFFLNSNEYSVGHPSISDDGNKLYFVSNMPGGLGGTDIYVCEFKSNKWSDPINLGPNVNTEDDEMFPYISSNGNRLYFSSNGRLGFGGLDIYYSEFENLHWSEAYLMEEKINSSYDDFAIYFIDDNMGFISSNRPGGKGSDDIYLFNEKSPIYISGVVVSDSGYLLQDASVFIMIHESEEILVLKTDSLGQYKTEVSPYSSYTVLAKKMSYLDDCMDIEIEEESKNLQDLILPQMLNKVYTVENIYYDLDKWFIRTDAEGPLNEVVAFLQENPVKIELSSHTDCRASHEYNERLSQRRAEAAVEYIVNQGIDTTRIVAKGFGETMLVNECADGVDCTEEQHQMNRRTEFKIIEIVNDSDNVDILDKYKHGEYYFIDDFEDEFFKKCMENQKEK